MSQNACCEKDSLFIITWSCGFNNEWMDGLLDAHLRDLTSFSIIFEMMNMSEWNEIKPSESNSVFNMLPDHIAHVRNSNLFGRDRQLLLKASWVGPIRTEEIDWGPRVSCIRTPWPAALRLCRRHRIARCAGVGAPSAAPPPSGSPAGSTRWRPSGSVTTQRGCAFTSRWKSSQQWGDFVIKKMIKMLLKKICVCSGLYAPGPINPYANRCFPTAVFHHQPVI